MNHQFENAEKNVGMFRFSYKSSHVWHLIQIFWKTKDDKCQSLIKYQKSVYVKILILILLQYYWLFQDGLHLHLLSSNRDHAVFTGLLWGLTCLNNGNLSLPSSVCAIRWHCGFRIPLAHDLLCPLRKPRKRSWESQRNWIKPLCFR